eukprot:CAMPEP_0184698654 /NCGR_PEP_ID=MMETSP0313-20130426/5195_1 /TAXON_ID=2792 /ORGANISM="Porphyridium aerugineum, Strain SAG 1380-2" /LENGTH=198 /DNA_ID=CAMNT_0027157621 /DNA_START=854 /DNA_END=1447 /DNA_ORIENTATION=+
MANQGSSTNVPSTAKIYNAASLEGLEDKGSDRIRLTNVDLVHIRKTANIIQDNPRSLLGDLYDPGTSARYNEIIKTDGSIEEINQENDDVDDGGALESSPNMGGSRPYRGDYSPPAARGAGGGGGGGFRFSTSPPPHSMDNVPDLVPLDASWLKPHPLLDMPLDDALEPSANSGAIEKDYGGNRDAYRSFNSSTGGAG